MSTAAASGMPETAVVLFRDLGTHPAPERLDGLAAELGSAVRSRDADSLLAGFDAVADAGAAALAGADVALPVAAVVALDADLPPGDPAGVLLAGAQPYLEAGVVLALGGAGEALEHAGAVTVTPFGQAALDGDSASLALARVDRAGGADATAYAAPGAAGTAAAGNASAAPRVASGAQTGTGGLAEITGAPPDVAIGPGFVLSHTYEIAELIGRGGMGTVYRARHLDLGTQHAIKIVSPEHGADERVIGLFRREAESLRRVRHDAVVSYDGVIRDEWGRLYLIMEFAQGPSLKEVLQTRSFTEAEAERLFQRLAAGLQAAHDKGIVHRDLSPDNIILGGGEIAQAKIIDFGIARDLEAGGRTFIGADFAGKYGYASPEQLGLFGGAVDNRSDIYSLGLVMAGVLGLRLDLGRTMSAAVERRQTRPDLTGLRAPWLDRLATMLAPDPADRPASLRAFLTPEPSAATAAGPARAGGARAGAHGGGRRRLLVPVLGLAALALAGVGGWLGWRALSGPGEAEMRRELAAAVAEHLPQPACGYLETALTPAAGGGFTLALRGVAGSSEGVRRIADSTAGLPHVAGVRNQMHVHAPPFCSVLAALHGWPGAGAPDLAFNRADATYTKGDRLILTATAGLTGTQHVYVAAVDSNGAVLHMLPNGVVPENTLARGESVTLGDGEVPGERRVYRAAAPFGPNLVVAAAADRPLFAERRPEVETLDAYLPALRRAVAAAREAGATVAVRHAFFTTEP